MHQNGQCILVEYKCAFMHGTVKKVCCKAQKNTTATEQLLETNVCNLGKGML